MTTFNYCPGCGRKVENKKHAFCPHCGEKLSASAAPKSPEKSIVDELKRIADEVGEQKYEPYYRHPIWIAPQYIRPRKYGYWPNEDWTPTCGAATSGTSRAR